MIDVDIRYLPEQDPADVLEQVSGIDDTEVLTTFTRPPAIVDRDSIFVQTLREATTAYHDHEPMSVGRDGASDAVSFLRVGVPAVEFGPVGSGSPRTRGVGLDRLPAELPAGARRLPASPARAPEALR